MSLVHVDTLIAGGHILTMDDGFAEVSVGAVGITGERISWLGTAEAAQALTAKVTLDASGCIIMPGLINTHCHAAMTMFRGLADDRPLQGFLNTVWAAEADHVRPSTVAAAAALGAAEMAMGGVTHFVDMYWHPAATISAARKVGLNLTSGPVFVGHEGVDRTTWDQRLARVPEFIAQHHGWSGLDLRLMPHAAYTLDAAKLRSIADLAESLGLGIHIHGAEAPWEMQMVAGQYDQARPIGVFCQTGLLGRPNLIAHGVHLDEAEIEVLAKMGSSISHCPLSNAKLASGTAPVAALRAKGVTVALGTDGASSGNDLDMWKAMRQAGFMQILATGTPEILPARDLLAMATREGAEALGMAADTGTLTIGKRADIIVVDLSGPHLIPNYEPYSTLVYAAGRDDVAHVFAAGRQIVRAKKLCADISEDIAVVQSIAARLKFQRNNQ